MADNLTRNENGVFVGTFVQDGTEYDVREEHYDKLTDEEFDTLGDRDLIKAIKIIVINEHFQQNKLEPDERQLRMKENEAQMRTSDDISKDPVPRFIGTILIYDANNLAHRCRHTFDLSHKGLDISVTYGVLRTMSYAQFDDVEAIVVCWDGGIPKYRKERLPEYKAHRSHDDEDDYEEMLHQMDTLHKLLPDLGVVSIREWGMEADDLVFHAAKLLHSDYLKVIVTNDQDLYQAVTYDVAVFNPNKKKLITVENFEEEVGVKPKDYLTFKSLVGDSSDGLIGCRGIGEKTAIKLINEYSSPSMMVNIATGQHTDTTKLMKPGVSEKLRTFGLKGFQDMYHVTRLDIDRIGAKQALMRAFKRWRKYDHNKVKKFLMENGFVSLAEPQFYKVFKDLKSPSSLLAPEIGYKVRFPTIIGRRAPLGASEENVNG